MRIKILGKLCLFGLVVLGFSLRNSAQSQRPNDEPAAPAIIGDIAKETKVNEDDVTKVLNAVGPELQRRLANGEQVALPGLGVFRVVQIPQHRDLQGGSLVMVTARNYVEFLPEANLVQSVNERGTKAAVIVPPFQYNPLPGQTKSPTVPRIRTPSRRIR